MASLTPIVSANPPLNPSVGWNNSWITIENDQDRSLYAQTVYVANKQYNSGDGNSVAIAYADGPNIDGFGRLRTSTPYTLFDSKTLHNKQSLFWSQTAVGTGEVQFTGSTDASVTLSAAANGDYAIRQTSQRFNYQPGKSQLALFTGVLYPSANSIKRLGLFTSLTSAPYTPNPVSYTHLTLPTKRIV